MCVQFIGDVHYLGGGGGGGEGVCSVHRGDTMSTSGGYHDACGGASW